MFEQWFIKFCSVLSTLHPFDLSLSDALCRQCSSGFVLQWHITLLTFPSKSPAGSELISSARHTSTEHGTAAVLSTLHQQPCLEHKPCWSSLYCMHRWVSPKQVGAVRVFSKRSVINCEDLTSRRQLSNKAVETFFFLKFIVSMNICLKLFQKIFFSKMIFFKLWLKAKLIKQYGIPFLMTRGFMLWLPLPRLIMPQACSLSPSNYTV